MRGPDFYDQPEIFETCQAGRARPGNANDTLEKPTFDELAGALRGLRILDLGCGDGRFGLEALEQDCGAYVGVEGSQNMFETAAANLAGSAAQVIQANLETWPYPVHQFDLVSARLVLHYLADLGHVFASVYNALVPGGRFIFSVEHPVITSCDRGRPPGTLRQDWIVDDYFDTGARVLSWKGGEVVKYHRTVEDYFGALRSAGFQVEAVRESRPRRADFTDEETYRRRLRIPLMLFMLAVRVG